MDNQSNEGDVWEERSCSLLREKRDVLKRDSKEFWKKKMRRWEDGGGIGNLRSDGCTFFFFLSHHFGNL